MQTNCQECHRTGGIAPFPLESLEDAVSHAGMMKKALNKGLMPPWFAAAQPGVMHSPFANDRSLTATDKADLLAWLDSSKPAGDSKDAPLPRQWPDAEWAIGKPDAIWEIPEPVDVKATGKMGLHSPPDRHATNRRPLGAELPGPPLAARRRPSRPRLRHAA